MKRYSEKMLQKIKEERISGKSILTIAQELNVPPTVVWYHVQGIILAREKMVKIKQNQGGSYVRKQRALEISVTQAKNLLISKERELTVAAAMLYWAEGNKKECEFINSDGDMIKVYLRFVREVLKIPDYRLKITVRIVDGMIKKDCVQYWEQITQISRKFFVVRINDGWNKSKTKYGMCRIRISKGAQELKIIQSIARLVIEQHLKK